MDPFSAVTWKPAFRIRPRNHHRRPCLVDTFVPAKPAAPLAAAAAPAIAVIPSSRRNLRRTPDAYVRHFRGGFLLAFFYTVALSCTNCRSLVVSRLKRQHCRRRSGAPRSAHPHPLRPLLSPPLFVVVGADRWAGGEKGVARGEKGEQGREKKERGGGPGRKSSSSSRRNLRRRQRKPEQVATKSDAACCCFVCCCLPVLWRGGPRERPPTMQAENRIGGNPWQNFWRHPQDATKAAQDVACCCLFIAACLFYGERAPVKGPQLHKPKTG